MQVLKKLRGKDNTSIVLRNTTISVLIKGGSLLIALFTTPAYLHYFQSDDVLGVWFTILSVLAWILNCDMGIGNGLRNHLVFAIHEKNWKKAKCYVSSAYIFLCAIGGLILLLFIVLGSVVDWNSVFNIEVDYIDKQTMRQVMSVLLASVIIQFVLRLVTSILYALQEAFVPGLLNLTTNVVMLVFVLIFNSIGKNDDILKLAFVYFFAVNMPLIVATVWVFIKKIPDARPSLASFNKQYALDIFKVGMMFLWLQVIALIIDNTNNYLISLFIGNEQVVEYQIYYKLFNLPVTMLMLLTASIWSTITKAKAENNTAWIKASFKKSMVIVSVVGLAEMAIIPFLQIIFNLWLGDKTIPVNYTSAFIVAFSAAIMGVRTVLTGFSNGLCELRIQMIYLTIGAIVNIPLAYLFARLFENYLAIVVANILSMLPFCFAQFFWCRKHILSYSNV